jgi:transposase
LAIEEGDIIGFVDESSQSLNANTQRFWSFEKPRVRKKTVHIKANSIACYMLNGIDVISFPRHTRSDDFCRFLQEVRKYNPINRICLILDNFSTHKSKIVLEIAKYMNIELIFLPPYSPDLNPIEFIWKSIKKAISTRSIENTLELIAYVKHHFRTFAMSLSFAHRWVEKFLVDKLSLLG